MKPISAPRSGKKNKPLKVKAFVLKCVSEGLLSPSQIKREYEAAYPNLPKKSEECFQKAVKRAGYTKQVREQIVVEARQKAAEKDIEQYEEVQSYIKTSKSQGTQASQVQKQLTNLRYLWELMGKTDPHIWTQDSLLTAIEAINPMITDERGRYRYEKPGRTMKLLSAFNTMFPNKLSPNWSANLCIHGAGELKDFFSFEEFALFLSKLTDTEHLSLEGWKALYTMQVNTQCREGAKATNDELGTGVLSARWENIDHNTKRMRLNEKGPHGKAGRIWFNLPLDMFPFIEGWSHLMAYWEQKGKPFQGRIFPINYGEYLEQFHRTRKACNGRISTDKASLRPHIFRRTSAQWKCELGVEIPEICGSFPDGSFGVGWDDPKILLKYYIQLSEKRKQKALKDMADSMRDLGLDKKKDDKDLSSV